MSFEVLRRVVLVLGLAASAWLSRLTPSGPFAAVLQPEFEKAHDRNNRPTPDGRTEGQLSMEEFIAYTTHGRVIPVEGPEWTAFFDKVAGALETSTVPDGWEHRVMPAELESSRKPWTHGEKTWKDFRRLHFWMSEAPLSGKASQLTAKADYYFKLDSKPPRYLEVYHHPFLKTTGLGSGFYGIPPAFAYPLKRTAGLLALASLLVYVLLPWPRREANIASVARWRVVGNDLASTGLLFLGFFAMPLFIVGSSVQAATEWLPFSLFFWGIASLGLVSGYWGALWGCFTVTVLEDRLVLGRLWGAADFPFQGLESIQRTTFQPPGWLVKVLWLFALLGGRRGLLAAGQAAIMGAAEAKGYLLRAKDGRTAYLWYTDQMGSTAMGNFDTVEKALKGSGAAMKEEPLQLKGVFPPFA